MAAKLKRGRILSPEDDFFVGFNFAERLDEDEKGFSGELLARLGTKSPRTKLRRCAKNTLRLAALIIEMVASRPMKNISRRNRCVELFALPLFGVLLMSAGIFPSGCAEEVERFTVNVAGDDAEIPEGDAGVYEAGLPADRLALMSVSPNHGSFLGGNIVTISGLGFTDQVVVDFDGKEVESVMMEVLGPTTLRVFAPAGEVGSADVSVARGQEKITITSAYHYDPITLSPNSGPTVGGTLITINGQGSNFQQGMVLKLDGEPLSAVQINSTTTLQAVTPPGSDGPADLDIEIQPGKTITIEDAFTYYSASNPLSGGMGGGPLQGTLTVTVLNWLTRAPVEDAKVIVEKDRDLLLTGNTDANGNLVFTNANLTGPISISAGKEEFETGSLIDFDARDVTVFLFPIIPPQPGPMGPGTRLGLVQGYVLFGGLSGVGSPQWKVVPEPKPGQIKRTYVYLANESVRYSPPTADMQATIDFADDGATAWPFSKYVRPGSVTVWALAGLFNQSDGSFEPYAMGLNRGVVVGPGETVNLDVVVSSALTEKVDLKLKDLPPEVNRHRIRLGIDLGADGVLMMPQHEISGDGVSESYTFGSLPAFTGPGLLDATYSIDLMLDTSSPTQLPLVQAIELNILPKNGEIEIGEFVGVPKQISPTAFGALQGNTLRWTSNGATPSIAVTRLLSSDQTPIWRIISDGNINEVNLPDPKTLGLPAWPTGPMVWQQWLVHLPQYTFDTYTYSHLSSTYWDRWSFNEFTFQITP